MTAQEENLDRIDYENDGAKVSHVTADSETLERKVPAVEVVTFQDPLKKNKLKQAVEAETEVSLIESVYYFFKNS